MKKTTLILILLTLLTACSLIFNLQFHKNLHLISNANNLTKISIDEKHELEKYIGTL